LKRWPTSKESVEPAGDEDRDAAERARGILVDRFDGQDAPAAFDEGELLFDLAVEAIGVALQGRPVLPIGLHRKRGEIAEAAAAAHAYAPPRTAGWR